jgi:mannose/cellobiose epimerase-like protein (N-acyl-D-glucosamine 2-epimerase family)
LLLVLLRSAACAQSSDLASQIPSGDRWLQHLTTDLLPFWSSPAALGNPIGEFPSTRCDDGSVLDFQLPCAGIAGNSYLLAPDRYLVPLSRQTYGYGVAYHLTGDPKYLAWMRAGVDYIRQHAIDPPGGMSSCKISTLENGVRSANSAILSNSDTASSVWLFTTT